MYTICLLRADPNLQQKNGYPILTVICERMKSVPCQGLRVKKAKSDFKYSLTAEKPTVLFHQVRLIQFELVNLDNRFFIYSYASFGNAL